MNLRAWLGALLTVLSSAIRLQSAEKVLSSADLGGLSEPGAGSSAIRTLGGGWPLAEDQCSGVGEILKPVLPVASPARFEHCALVSSSDDLKGQALGREIDEHDTVIHMNRIPVREYATDFGSRTDVLFTDTHWFTILGQQYMELGGSSTQLCLYHRDDCPVHTFVLKAVDSHQYGPGTFDEKFPYLAPGWVPRVSKLAVARQPETFDAVASYLLDYDATGTRPTMGFQAFLTCMLACKRLDLYGFSGNATADKHEVTDEHDLDLEHHLIREILDGNLTQKISGMFPAYGSCLAHKLKGVRR